MSLRLTAFTRRGVELAVRIRDALGEGEVWTLPKFRRGELRCYDSLRQWTAEQFVQGHDLLFVGAVGIAVRTIAPSVRDKWTDPAVLAVDEAGRWVIPLLSGHAGGANALAQRVAELLGAEAIVTTATDLRHRFAVDRWAAEQGLRVRNPEAAKAISAALLDGAAVGFSSELDHGPLPEGVVKEPRAVGFALTCRADRCFPPELLVLHPRLLTVGVGCRRGTPPERLEAALTAALEAAALSPESVEALASIDLKQDEPGLLELARRWSLPCRFYPAAELNALPGTFSGSEFVHSVAGTDCVCERSAVLASGGGTLLLRKRTAEGVTVAIARRAHRFQFESETAGQAAPVKESRTL